MILLVESKKLKSRGFIAAFRSRLQGRDKLSLSEDMVLGLKTLRVSVPSESEGARKKLLRLISEKKISTVFIRDDFLHPEWFERYRRPAGDELMRRMAGRIAVLAAQSFDYVAVYLRHVDSHAGRTIRDLCGSFRYVAVISEVEGALKAAETIAGEMGVSVMVNPSDGSGPGPDAAVILDMPGSLMSFGRGCVAVAPSEDYYKKVDCARRVTDAEFALPDGKALSIPPGYSQKAIISEAILRGGIRFEEICIKSLEISP